jgi:hypothetical protein
LPKSKKWAIGMQMIKHQSKLWTKLGSNPNRHQTYHNFCKPKEWARNEQNYLCGQVMTFTTGAPTKSTIYHFYIT